MRVLQSMHMPVSACMHMHACMHAHLFRVLSFQAGTPAAQRRGITHSPILAWVSVVLDRKLAPPIQQGLPTTAFLKFKQATKQEQEEVRTSDREAKVRGMVGIPGPYW